MLVVPASQRNRDTGTLELSQEPRIGQLLRIEIRNRPYSVRTDRKPLECEGTVSRRACVTQPPRTRKPIVPLRRVEHHEDVRNHRAVCLQLPGDSLRHVVEAD